MELKETPDILRKGNCIIVNERLSKNNFRWFLSEAYKAVNERGFGELTLDFTKCTAAFPGSMLAICAQMMDYSLKDINVNLVLPKNENLAKLFVRSNWAHLIDSINHKKSLFKGFTMIPATQFINTKEHYGTINDIIRVILGSMRNITRAQFAALEWSLNEITDNVLNHSQSSIGGLVQVTTFQRQNRRIEFVVCDAGIGIPKSIRASFPEILSDTDALDKAIREGVTRDIKIGQGNGLYGSFKICEMSGGYFQIHSGHSQLTYSPAEGLHIKRETIPFDGTLVIACIDCSQPNILEGALKIKSKEARIIDYIELKYESDDNRFLNFKLIDESFSFGSRSAGNQVRIKLSNLATMCMQQKIIVDFIGIPIISSSFADEVFGKLFVEIGPIEFTKRFDFVNIDDTVKSLIDKAILQRSSMI